MEATIYNTQGKKSGTIDLPEQIFGVEWNDALMHQVVTSMQANARTPVAHVKDRGAVRGGGKKPWRQKGTGRARHGSIRSPIWKGGGVTHGPLKDKNYARAIPKKMRAKALFMALSRKQRDGQILFVDSFMLDTPKTAAASKAIRSFALLKGFEKLVGKKASHTTALIALSDPNESSLKSFRNLSTVETSAVRDLNPLSVLKYRYIVIENPEAAIAIVSHRASKDNSSSRIETENKKLKTGRVLKDDHAA